MKIHAHGSTGADMAGGQNTRLKRGCSKLYCGSKHSFYAN